MSHSDTVGEPESGEGDNRFMGSANISLDRLATTALPDILPI